MAQIWLHTNRRALLLGMIVPGALLAAGIGLLAVYGLAYANLILLVLGILLAIGGGFGILNVLYWLRLPRLAYQGGELLVFVRGTQPIRVPIEIVEVFFLGQGSAPLPQQGGRDTETTNIVVRLAESAQDWKHRDVDPRLGLWCENYITLYGSWCEPIAEPQMTQLNQWLIEAHREQRQRSAQVAR
jgi:hypothetical protein